MKALLAIDGSDASNLAVTAAASLAWPEGSEVEIVSVIPIDVELFGGPWPAAAYAQSSEVRDRLQAELNAGLVQAAATIKRDGLIVSTRLLEGRPASEIVRSATADEVDLIILGARGHGTFERLLVGSVSAEVVDLAPCPVLVARHSASGRVLAGADGSPDAQLALDFVAASGLWRHATVRVATVIDVPAGWWLGITPVDAVVSTQAYVSVQAEASRHGRELADAAAAHLAADGVVADAVVREGDPAAAIVAEAIAWGADVIVVGMRGHGLLKRFLLGSTARKILHHAPMSVLIVRGEYATTETGSKGAHR
jgi:nucleotide-binding universal stress UspA family protein